MDINNNTCTVTTPPRKRIKVWVRVRPTANFATGCLDLQPDNKSINIHFKGNRKWGIINNAIYDWSFGKFDGIFHNKSQADIFSNIATDVISSALMGISGSFICFGQTGAGKTYTMSGMTENYFNRGLIPRSISYLFQEINKRFVTQNITVKISYLEVYNNTLYDLLSTFKNPKGSMGSQPLEIAETASGVYVKGLSCHNAESAEDAFDMLFEGETNRAVAAHSLNRVSSRSHCIFTMNLEVRARGYSNPVYTISRLNFVDLAGSEKAQQPRSAGKMVTETLYINKSLCFLEQVMLALGHTSQDLVPFRTCKLTHYLKDSIGGRCHTHFIANIWGEVAQLEETMHTLRFATRTMSIPMEPVIMEVFETDTCRFCLASHERILQITQLQKEVAHLKAELVLQRAPFIGPSPINPAMKNKMVSQCRKYFDAVEDIKINNLKEAPIIFNAMRDIYNQAEQEIEEKMKKKFLTHDKSKMLQRWPKDSQQSPTPAIMQVEQSTSDDDSCVGETDGTGYGVGTAPKNLHPEPSTESSKGKPEAKRRKSLLKKLPLTKPGKKEREGDKDQRSARGSSVKGDKHRKSSQSTTSQKRSSHPTSPVGFEMGSTSAENELDTELEPGDQTRPSTPPSRSSAFEDFKREKGQELSKILMDNKMVLAEKKKAYDNHAKKINKIKRDIDETRQILQQLQAKREEEGPTYTDDGDIVISEKEFAAIQQLKALKLEYHSQFPELNPLNTQMQHCKNLVQQCRQCLLKEFDKWYNESFVGDTGRDELKSQTTRQTEKNESSTRHGELTRLAATPPPTLVLQTTLSELSEAQQVPRQTGSKQAQENESHTQPFITIPVPEDQEEYFARRRMELWENNVDSAAYYNARFKTQRRKMYQSALSQPQLHYNKRSIHTLDTKVRSRPCMSKPKIRSSPPLTF